MPETTPSQLFVGRQPELERFESTLENPAGQINDTIENVHAVLKDMKCSDQDVVQVLAYCKNSDVEKIFHQYKKKLSWPWLTIVCDICRTDLLFEIEVTAAIRQ